MLIDFFKLVFVLFSISSLLLVLVLFFASFRNVKIVLVVLSFSYCVAGFRF